MRKQSLILQRQVELREVGRIRIGEKAISAAGKEYPRGRDTFRFTSANKIMLEVMREAFGGEVTPFKDHPGQWDLSSKASQISVIVTADNVSQAYEQWSGGGCTHRCDGRTCHRVIVKKKGEGFDVDESDVECVCDPDYLGVDLPDRERACKLTTRLKVMIPGSRDIGLWRLESHGVIFADETMALLRQFAEMQLGPVYCILTLGWQEIKKPGKPPSRFVVPSISIDPNPPAFASTMIQSTLSHQLRRELANPAHALPGRVESEPVIESVEAHVVEDEPMKPTAKTQTAADLPLPPGWSADHATAKSMAQQWDKEMDGALSKDKGNWDAFQTAAKMRGFYWPALLIMAKEEGAESMPDALGWLHGWKPPEPKSPFETGEPQEALL